MRVLTIGTFDTPHAGHVELFKGCRALAGPDGEVTVGLNTDEFVEQFKGRRPLMSYKEREEVLWGFKNVNYITPNTEGANAAAVIENGLGRKYDSSPAALVIGSDWHGDKYLTQLNITWDYLRKHNIILCYIPRKERQEISSTILKARLLNES